MRIVSCQDPAAPTALVTGEAPDPRPGREEVVIRVTAAGVNNADRLQVAGHYPPPPGAPDWPGLEVSGVVSEAGPGSRWAVGTEVVALLAGGGWASHVLVPDGQVLPAPRGVDLVAAAALPEAACTVWSTFAAAGLRPGEWVLVHGGSGGIGSHAVQVARARGARVITTAGGPERVAWCRDELGADVALDHRADDVVAAVRATTGGDGVDVVLDLLGAGGLAANLACLAVGGRLAVIGLQRGARAELDMGLLLARRLTVLGTTLRSRPAAEKAAIVAAVREHVWPMVEAGSVRPVVGATLPLELAGDALALLGGGGVLGKVLLLP
jgi:putative PIG3 family NAD(P)H quinone oxidoreductase